MTDWLRDSKRLVVVSNNYCNLACPGCNMGCDKTTGSHHLRTETWEIDLPAFKMILDVLGPHIPAIRLVGGETTAMSKTKLQAMIEMAWNQGIPLSFITNGYALLDLDARVLCKLEYIVLDDHGLNRAHLDVCEGALKSLGIPTHRINRLEFIDIPKTSKLARKTGRPCRMLQNLPAVYDGVFYPCCGLYFNDVGSHEYMYNSGWTLDNPEILDTSANLNETLPWQFWRDCLRNCYSNAIKPMKYSIEGKVGGVVRK